MNIPDKFFISISQYLYLFVFVNRNIFISIIIFNLLIVNQEIFLYHNNMNLIDNYNLYEIEDCFVDNEMINNYINDTMSFFQLQFRFNLFF